MNSEKKILIVDDASFMRHMLKRAMGKAGDYTILEAPDGETALELFRQQRPDLVFLDISMPGMDGIEVLKQLKQMDGCLPVLMCSAIGQERKILEAMENGAADFIVKPFKEEQIIEAVCHVFPAGKEGL